MMQSLYLLKQSSPFYVRCVRLGSLMRKISDVMLLLYSLYEVREDGRVLRKTHRNSAALQSIRIGSFLLRIEAADLYINDPTT